jgi:hypothetical protein
VPSVVRRSFARPVALAAGLGVLALAGCGGGGDASPDEVVSPSPVDLTPSAKVELARGIYKENDPGGSEKPLVSGTAATCIADDLVKSFGVQGLINIGAIDNKAVYSSAPRSIPAPEAEKWIAAFEDCLDLDDYMLGIARAGVRIEAPAYGELDSKWAQARTCLDGAPGASHAVMLGQLTAKPQKDGPTAAFVDCIKIAYPQATP